MKEHAKLYKAQKKRTVNTLSNRLQQEEEKDGDLMQDAGGAEKKKSSQMEPQLSSPTPLSR